MENKSFLSKIIYILIILVIIVIVTFFVMNDKEVKADIENIETITSLNANTYDLDMYIYKLENNKLYTSEYFYNKFYLDNNNVTYDEFDINNNTKFYLKTLSNTATNINDIKITYDLITQEEFEFLLENYTLLKTNIWLNKDDTVKNVLLYSSSGIELEME